MSEIMSTRMFASMVNRFLSDNMAVVFELLEKKMGQPRELLSQDEIKTGRDVNWNDNFLGHFFLSNYSLIK